MLLGFRLFKNLGALLFILFFNACNTIENRSKLEVQFSDSIIADDSSNLYQLFTQMVSVDSIQRDSLYQNAILIQQKGKRQEFLFELFKLRYWINIGKRDEAYTEIVNNISDYQDTLHTELGNYYNLLGIYYTYEGRIKEAVKAYDKGIHIFEQNGNLRNAAVIRQNMVNIFYSSMDYSQAYNYALAANKVFRKLNDTDYLPINESLLAISAIGMDSLKVAETYIESVKKWSQITNQPIVKILSNFASGEYALSINAYSDAIFYFNQCIELSKKHQNFMMFQPVLASLVRANVSAGLFNEAISNGNQLLQISKQTGNKDIGYSVQKNMAYAYAGLKIFDSAFTYMKNAEQIFQETRKLEGQDALQELMIKYDAELKNNQILTQQNEIGKQRGWILFLSMMALLGFILFLWKKSVDKNRQQLIFKNKEKEILQALFDGEEKERSRLADELHNGIASNLVAIRIQLENAFETQRDNKIQSILDIITRTHEETRLIAHNLQTYDFTQHSIIERLRNFCNECSTPHLPIYFSSNLESIPLNNSKSVLLYRCIQECIQNSIKHAKASQINVQILGNKDDITCSVEDDGIGFDSNKILHESSINKLKIKLQNIDMNLNVDSQIENGASIFITFKI